MPHLLDSEQTKGSFDGSNMVGAVYRVQLLGKHRMGHNRGQPFPCKLNVTIDSILGNENFDAVIIDTKANPNIT